MDGEPVRQRRLQVWGCLGLCSGCCFPSLEPKEKDRCLCRVTLCCFDIPFLSVMEKIGREKKAIREIGFTLSIRLELGI